MNSSNPSTSPITQTTLETLARAIFAALGQTDPDLALKGKLRLLPSSVGGRNYLWEAQLQRGRCLLKLRSDPNGLAYQEGEILHQLPPGLAPALWSHVVLDELRDQAAARRDFRALKALDVAVGDGLVMSWVPGEPPAAPHSLEALHQTGRSLARLHLHRPAADRPLARHGFPQRPTSMLRVCEDLFEELQARKILSRDTEDAIATALQALGQHVGLQRLTPRAPHQGICHGDLRWHNMHRHQDDLYLVDWEDAGIGDPAIDLAMMVCRTPLSWWEELCVLEAYTTPQTRGNIDRFFVIRPLVGLLSALGAWLDLVDIADGIRPTTEEGAAFLSRRVPGATIELQEALRGVLGIEATLPPCTVTLPAPVPAQPCGALVAIDGPSVSFKSPFARGLAQSLGLPYYNKGALFRYVALWAHCHRRQPDDKADLTALCNHLKRTNLTLLPDGAVRAGQARFEHSLYLPCVEQEVAAWAAMPEIRAILLPVFQEVLQTPCVIEGRDVGTVLAPHADIKLYVTATIARRVEALVGRSGVTRAQAKQLLGRRDQQDRQRAHSPLQQAPDAICVTLDPDKLDKDIALWGKKIRQQMLSSLAVE